MALPVYTGSQLISLARDMSDMQGTDFVSDAELLTYINLGLSELHDLLAEAHGQEFFLRCHEMQISDPVAVYNLPDDFLVLKGVDYQDSPFGGATTSSTEGGGELPVTTTTITYDVPIQGGEASLPLRPYTFFERRQKAWDKGFTPRFRVFTDRKVTVVEGGEFPGTTVEFFHRIRFQPVRSGYVLVWYLPTAPRLIDVDSEVVSIYGFDEYPALYAAYRALAKEESDASSVLAMLETMRERICRMAAHRDAGHPERVQDFGV